MKRPQQQRTTEVRTFTREALDHRERLAPAPKAPRSRPGSEHTRRTERFAYVLSTPLTHYRELHVIAALSLCFSGGVAIAQEMPEVTWKAETELGIVNTTGNTETENVNARGKVVNERQRWRYSGTALFVRATDQDETKARRFAAQAKADYKFTERSYIFGVLTYEDDRFSGYDYQASIAAGYGRKLIAREGLSLEGEAGPGVRRNKPDGGDTEDEGILRGALNLDWKISDPVTFVELFSVEAGEDITITQSETALKSQIAGNLASKISYTVRHASEVPPETEKTDTTLAVTLVYSF